jgi:hypothetical protein
MKELYSEGLAIHGDPEPWVGIREDAGEALAGARAGRATEPRNGSHSGSTLIRSPKFNAVLASNAVRTDCRDFGAKVS